MKIGAYSFSIDNPSYDDYLHFCKKTLSPPSMVLKNLNSL